MINYLDVTLVGGHTTGTVYTHTCRKECAGKSLSLATSCHPSHTIRSIPVGEFIRARRNCSSPDSFLQEFNIITSRLKERGYQDWHINRGVTIAKNRDRCTLLTRQATGICLNLTKVILSHLLPPFHRNLTKLKALYPNICLYFLQTRILFLCFLRASGSRADALRHLVIFCLLAFFNLVVSDIHC